MCHKTYECYNFRMNACNLTKHNLQINFEWIKADEIDKCVVFNTEQNMHYKAKYWLKNWLIVISVIFIMLLHTFYKLGLFYFILFFY